MLDVALDGLEVLVGVPAQRQVAADVPRVDPVERVVPAAQAPRSGRRERVAPPQRLVAGEPRHQHRHHQAFLYVDQPLPHEQVPEHLEVLDRDRVAVVVVRDRLGGRGDALALGDGVHDRGALAAHRRRALRGPVAQLVQRVRRGLAGGVLPGLAVGAREATADAEQATDRAEDAGHAEAAADAAGGGVRAAACRLRQRPGDDLADVPVPVEAGVDPVARRTRLLAAGHLAAFPVDHGELLLLAGSEGEAVEQVAHRVAVGHPLLLEPQHVAVRDRRGLVDGQVVVPEDRVLAGEPTPAGLARDGATEEPVQVRVQREPGCAGDATRGDRAGVPGQRLQHVRVDVEVLRQRGQGAADVLAGVPVVRVAPVRPTGPAGEARAARVRVTFGAYDGCLLQQPGQELVDDATRHLARLLQGQPADLGLGGPHAVGEGVLLQRPVGLGEVDAAPGAGVGGEGAVGTGEVGAVGGAGRLGPVATAAVVLVLLHLGEVEDEDHRLGELLALEVHRHGHRIVVDPDGRVRGAELAERVRPGEVAARVGGHDEQGTEVGILRVVLGGSPDHDLQSGRRTFSGVVDHLAAELGRLARRRIGVRQGGAEDLGIDLDGHLLGQVRTGLGTGGEQCPVRGEHAEEHRVEEGRPGWHREGELPGCGRRGRRCERHPGAGLRSCAGPGQVDRVPGEVTDRRGRLLQEHRNALGRRSRRIARDHPVPVQLEDVPGESLHREQVLELAERPLRLAVLHDPACQRLVDHRQAHELLDGRDVDVEPFHGVPPRSEARSAGEVGTWAQLPACPSPVSGLRPRPDGRINC